MEIRDETDRAVFCGSLVVSGARLGHSGRLDGLGRHQCEAVENERVGTPAPTTHFRGNVLELWLRPPCHPPPLPRMRDATRTVKPQQLHLHAINQSFRTNNALRAWEKTGRGRLRGRDCHSIESQRRITPDFAISPARPWRAESRVASPRRTGFLHWSRGRMRVPPTRPRRTPRQNIRPAAPPAGDGTGNAARAD